jgi:hypothetical protein
VEATEDGFHSIAIANQAGCTVGSVYVAGALQHKSGPQTVSVHVDSSWKTDTLFIDVVCQ